MNYAFINGQLIIFDDSGAHYNINDSHPEWPAIIEAIKNEDFEEVIKLYENDLTNKVNTMYAENGVVYDAVSESVYLNGEKLHSHIAKRVVEHAKAGLPFENLLRFIERLEANPSMSSRNELYDFLEVQHMPITEDGCFLGYKSVRANFTDWHSRKFDNRVGQTVSIPRRDVDDNRNKGCSKGLHVGSLEYAQSFRNCSNRQLILVKIDPANVVSVPNDDHRKLRCCEYEVVSLFKEELKSQVYSIGDDYVEPIDDLYEDDYEWEDDDFWSDEDDE
jgi:hypothetical protein